jgi:hypothetical protein
MPEFKTTTPVNNLNQYVNQEKFSFLENILYHIGLPMKENFPSGLTFSPENKIKLRTLLFNFGNNIFYSETENGIKIFCDGELIAELFPPEKVLHFVNQKPYFELRYRYMSLFEKD